MNEHVKPQNYQQRVLDWTLDTFGADVARDIQERCHRFLEEGLELVQSLGCTASEAHQLVDYVFGRAVGDPEQEIGGTMVCIAALAHAARLDMANAAEKELASNWERQEKIREKWLRKPKHSPLPIVDSDLLPPKTVAHYFLDTHPDISVDAIADLIRRARNDGIRMAKAAPHQVADIVINEEAHGHG